MTVNYLPIIESETEVVMDCASRTFIMFIIINIIIIFIIITIIVITINITSCNSLPLVACMFIWVYLSTGAMFNFDSDYIQPWNELIILFFTIMLMGGTILPIITIIIIIVVIFDRYIWYLVDAIGNNIRLDILQHMPHIFHSLLLLILCKLYSLY